MAYTDFESSDAAVESMNGQFLMNKAITVQYAFKKDGKGERHGTQAERLLAAQARKNNALPVSARPPPASMPFGAPQPGFQGPYQGQFAGALAQPPPPPGFSAQQTIMPQMQMQMAPPGMGMQMQQMQGMSPMPGMGMPGYGSFPPPPPPGFAVQYPGQVPGPPPQF